jgi:hypothetical protein
MILQGSELGAKKVIPEAVSKFPIYKMAGPLAAIVMEPKYLDQRVVIGFHNIAVHGVQLPLLVCIL